MGRMISLEDNHEDIIGKAMKGLGFSQEDLVGKSGVEAGEVQEILAGKGSVEGVRGVATPLGLDQESLVASFQKSWHPRIDDLPEGVAMFTSAYGDMTVNAYVIWDKESKEAILFDTGANADEALAFLGKEGLALKLILITHSHGDHIAEFERVVEKTGAQGWVHEAEMHPVLENCEVFQYGKVFQVGSLEVETIQTSGHAKGGTTYFIKGLDAPVAVVGDALFAGSMGGGMVSYEEALRTNRENLFVLPEETLVCPGHGPVTCLAFEKINNPFFAS